MYDFKFADIGEGIHEGKILKWYFKVGDKVKEGETLVVVETDKVNAELPSPVDGIVKKLGGKEGDLIEVGDTIVIIDDGSTEEVKEEPKVEPLAEGENAPSVIGALEVTSEVMASSDESNTVKEVESKKVLATPVARKLAKDLGVDIQNVNGSGEHGRVMKEDIYQATEQKQTPKVERTKVSVSVQGDVEYVPITKLRKAIVNSMTKAKDIIPHSTIMDEIVIDKLVDLRNRVKEQAAAENIKLTYMAFIIKAVVLALKEYPFFNASYDEVKEQMVYKKFYNIGMAVDTKDGLIVPNIKDADQKSILELAREIRDVADRTIERKVQLHELQNTTFSITNFGASDLISGTPIINHPEVAILGVGKISQRAMVIDGEIKAAYVLPLSLSIDHRVIDGADAGRFLTKIKSLLKEPMMLLLN
ncbi:MAG: dihydrolipoamide acetyltransferase family protein [Acholeplasmataceae bacterium]|nr:dihydrolipoamide acetyltransferase family protein [Acholeplasmataceae bacterium]MDD4194067.1 dihydrolipoamide acetyltransferase family protein [Acholeplasmataceae bacterium]